MYQPPFVAPQPASSSDVKQVSISLDDSSSDSIEKMIILYTRDIDQQEASLFQRYGKVLNFSASIYAHLQPREYQDQFDYLFIDLRVSANRRYFERVDKSGFKIISYVYFFEVESPFIQDLGDIVVKAKLPPVQAFKKDFDALLQSKSISSPNKILSCVSYFLNILRGFSAR